MKEKWAKIVLSIIILGSLFLFGGCGNRNNAAVWRLGKVLAKEKIKVGMIYVTDPLTETSGYSYAHEMGIREMQERLGLKDEQIITKIHVQDTDAEGIESAMRDCIAKEANIIIATSWGYMDSCEKLALEFPHVVFAHASGYKYNSTNFTNYFGRIYQARYLSGIAAGLKTKTGKVGYVAAMGKDSSEVTGGLNAFALGVESVNSKAKIQVQITYSWFDPMEEANAARRLIAAGCDVIAQHCDTPLPMIEAESAGVWGLGYNSDMSKEAPLAVISSVLWNWGAYYTFLVQSVIDGSFTTEPYFGGIGEGLVDITPPNMLIAAPGTTEAIEKARNRMINKSFNVFDGILEANDGRTIGEAGFTLADSEITGNMSWYYRNVEEN
ncbi:membrane protein, Bmp family [Treponema primitia ZAS-2]|uniref:Membrane protein, Bmp family n=1 Tax=Treponema primitia (strain ATCC BAA-887 / DSM 12427 / ZAS-2) TaxID=545694 RepID=F5YRH7_TREPZ|nr:BMP family ABC transporter substrate-binding protein [Treponema primitia]AEF84158.1 membrane protein, Bmp family [Treponema primitia ZAS-2]